MADITETNQKPAPRKGDLGWASLAGGREVDPEEFVDDRAYFGLTREAARGLVEVEGSQVGPGLQWYLPGRDAAIYYPTTTWQVTGTVLGRPVQGFLFYEEAYVPPGGRLYVEHDPLLGDQLHTTWPRPGS